MATKDKLINLEDLKVLSDHVEGEVTDLKSDFGQIAERKPNLFNGSFDSEGYINTTTGANVSNENYKRTSEFFPFDISNGNSLYIHLSEATSNFQIVIYKADKATVQGTQSCNNLTDVRTSQIQESGYFRLYTNASFSGLVYIGQDAFSVYGEYKNYKIPLNALDIDVQSSMAKTNLISQRVGKNIFNPSADGVVVGSYLDGSGNLIELAGWNTSDFIDISEFSSIVGSIFDSSNAYFTYAKLNFLTTYTSDKTRIKKVWDTSSNGVYEKETNVSFIRFCWQNNELQNGRKIMLESGTSHSLEYEPYELSTFIDSSAYPTFEEVEELIQSGGSEQLNDVVCWGDSLTYSQYSESIKYPQRLAELANVTVKNFGMPGANSMDISGLQGGMPIYLEPFTLPADTSQVTVSLIDVNGNNNYIGLLHHMPRAGWVNDIQAMNNYWLVDGIPVMLIYSSGAMKLYRLSAGTSAITFDRPIKLTSVQDYSKEQIQVFWVGTNDAPTTEEKANRTVDVIKNMVNYYGGNRYLVLGLTVKSYADKTNNLMGQTFGNHYVDVKDYLIKYGLADNNISATAQDTDDIANGIVPTSLRHDSVHFNDYGYKAVGNCVYQHGKDLGYWN